MTRNGLVVLVALGLGCAEDDATSGPVGSADVSGGADVSGVGDTLADAGPTDVAEADLAAPDAQALDTEHTEQDDVAAPRCQRRDPLRLPFFGDLHVHTALSLDANLQGTRLRPADAYRFARGEAVGISPYDADGKPLRTLKLERPLDFVALSDHAEFLGLVTTCLTPGLPGYDSADCDTYRNQPDVAFFVLNGLTSAAQDAAVYGGPCDASNENCGGAALSAWQEVISAAQAANDTSDQCGFTAFIAYEWSASPGTRNLHRNVIFGTEHVPALPFTYFDGAEEEALWSALESQCTAADGCRVLTIPHNSNLSSGLMFEPLDKDDAPIDRDYAERRARMEPLVEIFQHKGSSECLPEMGADEACEDERIPWSSLGSAALAGAADEPTPSDFVRHALGQGLVHQRDLGMDPFQYGFIASTDTHLGTPGAVDEQDYPGHGGAGNAAQEAAPVGLVDKVWFNPGGLAVLWAEENTREALFAAMRRREAYGTTGPRIILRLVAGPDVPADLCDAEDFAAAGDATGVPMGGVLPADAKGMRLAVRAAMDPGTAARPGARLERLQVVKGWLEGGEVKYRVTDIAGAPDPAGAVDPATCVPSQTGPAELCAVWDDPDFSAETPAFWYVRVLENPTCRWQATVCREVDCAGDVPKALKGCCNGPPAIHQERAWSSPVFFGVTPPPGGADDLP